MSTVPAHGWVEATDQKTGRVYYYNKLTKKTQWTKPAELEAGATTATTTATPAVVQPAADPAPGAGTGGADPEANPANWREATDPKSGRTYYFCKVTNKTSWKKPACLETGGSPSPAATTTPAETATTATPATAPATTATTTGSSGEDPENVAANWAETKDPKTARVYYYNRVTKKTSWKKPACVEALEPKTAEPAKTEEPKPADGPVSPKSDARKRLADSSDDEKDKEKPKGAASPTNAGKKGSDSDDDKPSAGGAEGNKGNMMNVRKAMQDQELKDAKAKLADDSEEQAIAFEYQEHRHGFLNRLLHVGKVFDEQKLLSYKKSLIKKALLKMNADLDAEAVQCFKNLMSYMGDRKSSKAPIDHSKKLLRNLMNAPAGLRDECYMQVCKQTTANPKLDSCIKGWELMLFCLATFPPSKHLKAFLADYIDKHTKDGTPAKVLELAKLAAQRLPTIILMGQRKQVPSALELECLRECKPVPLRVNLVNGSFKTFNVDPYTLVQDVQDQLVQKYSLIVTSPFALYEAAEANVERILDPKDRILDVYASWENKPLLDESGKGETFSGKTKSKDKMPVVAKEAKQLLDKQKKVQYNSFLYKAKLVLKTTSKEIMSDPECVNLIYLQAVSDVVTSRYPANEKDVTVLAALQLQATHGDFKKDVHLAGWLTPKLAEYMPKDLLVKKGKGAQKLEKEWEQLILAKYAKVSGFTALEAKLNYLDYVQEWVFYGATFFIVEQRQFKDYPSPLILGINCEGVLLMHPEKKTVLENYQYTDIVTWGHSDEKFIVVVGNIVQQRKLIFKTPDGKAMNHLIHDYVKFKVKNK